MGSDSKKEGFFCLQGSDTNGMMLLPLPFARMIGSYATSLLKNVIK